MAKEEDGDNGSKKQNVKDEDGLFKLKAGAFLAATAGIAAIAGFGGALATARKSDPSAFDKGLVGQEAAPENGGANANGKLSAAQLQQHQDHLRRQARLQQTGASLAARALGYGTLYACAGCAALFYAIWKISGAKDLKDFRTKAGSILPAIPKNSPPQGRTEFSGVNDFLQYLIDEDEKKKGRDALKNEVEQKLKRN